MAESPLWIISVSVTCVVCVLFPLCMAKEVTYEIDQSLCKHSEINLCIGEEQTTLGVGIIPYLSDNDLQKLCNDWPSTKSCLEDIVTSCGGSNTTDLDVKTSVKQTISELTKGRDFMCDAGNKQMYLSTIRPCYLDNNSTLFSANDECLGRYRNETWYLDRGNQLNAYKFCKSGNSFLDCQEKAAKDACGDGAKKWVSKYHSSLWDAHFENIECRRNAGLEVSAIVFFSLCAGATVYCVIFVVLGFARDSDKCKCSEGLRRHTKSGYQLQSQNGK